SLFRVMFFFGIMSSASIEVRIRRGAHPHHAPVGASEQEPAARSAPDSFLPPQAHRSCRTKAVDMQSKPATRAVLSGSRVLT
ncbi:hypothetical protein, partial [Paraburkholderia sediminicola]|uniref:hypothetical protein n=1 Tax=Paraburkholderia sediminicola TaxID=458836 RepID=UPI0038BB8E9A